MAIEDDYYIPVDPEILQKERRKAQELRKSQWWKQRIGPGICHYCQEKFSKEQLTMDHIMPLSRGGKTSKRNVVPACKPCNTKKKHLTMAELRRLELEAGEA
jgi:5-methylcytosine-specific restriction endonuclease McrA